ncbi:hypothetical protein GCM10025734_42350 [Kitasatospora paranensis]
MTADQSSGAAGQPAAVQAIAAGYAFSGPALDLGAALQGTTAYPDAPVRIPLGVLNRHGLVAGATGTGKTKTLQLIAEQLSAQGVPVFLADIKGDVSGIAAPGPASDRVTARAADVGQHWTPQGCPAEFYALGGQGTGIPVRATVTSFGPLLLSKVLDLNETQEASLGLVFHYADRNGLELYDLKDLTAVIGFLTSPEGKEELKGIGGLSAATAGVILRSLTVLDNEGAGAFFGEPEFDTADLLRTTDGEAGAWSRCWNCLPCRTGRGCSRPSSCGCSPTCTRSCPRWATSTSRSWCSSSTRRTCSSRGPRRRSWRRSRRPSG